MYQQYLGQAKAAIAYLSTQELNELIDDNEKLEERINNVVSKSPIGHMRKHGPLCLQ